MSRNNGDCIESTRSNRRYPDIPMWFGVPIKTHRLSYLVYKGELRQNICHSCDNVKCFNPEHLWQGTQSENMKDCYGKGRGNKAIGERHAGSVLTERDLEKIAELYHAGDGAINIAKKLKLSRSAIKQLLRGKTWKHMQYKFKRDLHALQRTQRTAF